MSFTAKVWEGNLIGVRAGEGTYLESTLFRGVLIKRVLLSAADFEAGGDMYVDRLPSCEGPSGRRIIDGEFCLLEVLAINRGADGKFCLFGVVKPWP